MHSVAEDVPLAITNVLSTHNWRARKQLIDTVFADDVHFWHLFHDCKNKRELFGVYQMWGKGSPPPVSLQSTACLFTAEYLLALHCRHFDVQVPIISGFMLNIKE